MADSTQNTVEERHALQEYLDAAREFARIGGEVSLGWFRADALEVERKADDSPVTVADRRTEEAMREAILRRFPDHRIVGEEFGGELGAHRYQWVIDPIDGTKTFVRGVPLYTTLVALVIDGNPAVGVIYCPPTGEMASAALGCGAWDERGRRMHVSDTERLEDAWFFSTDPADLLRRHPEWGHALLTRSAAVRTWADAYGYLLLARGDADLMFDPVMSPWDIAPLSVVVREAGGVFTDDAGAHNDLGSSALCASSSALHDEALRLRR